MGRLTDLERRALKERKSPKALAEKVARRAAALVEKRRLNLERNLVREELRALEDERTAQKIDHMIARGEKGFNGVDIVPMGVEKYTAKVHSASRKLDSVTGQYDVDDE